MAAVVSFPVELPGGGDGDSKPEVVESRIVGTPDIAYVDMNDGGNVVDGDWMMASNAWATFGEEDFFIILKLRNCNIDLAGIQHICQIFGLDM